MKVALIVDNPYRDLPGLILTAAYIAQQGVTCYLVPLNLATREIKVLRPDYVLVNYLRKNNQKLVQLLINVGMGIGVLDTEGGVFTNVEAYEQTIAPNQSIRYAVDHYFSWGPAMARHATERGWYQPEQIHITGHPRFSFYVAPWREAALQASYANHFPQPLVLLNSNFPLVNPAFKTPEREKSILVEVFGFDMETVQGWADQQQETLNGMVALANRLASQFPDVTFVYRPHPFEKLDTYWELLDKRDNLHLIKQGAVDGWILRASAVIQRSCSTAIESAIAGIPSLSPVWLPTRVLHKTAESVSIPCQSEDELIEMVRTALEGDLAQPPNVRESLEQVVADWFYQMDGQAHIRVADEIISFLRKRASDNNRHSGDKRRNTGKNWGNMAGFILRSVRGEPISQSLRKIWRYLKPPVKWDASEKSFGESDVRGYIGAIEKVTRKLHPESWHTVLVKSASQFKDYRPFYIHGRSVKLWNGQ